jgi:protein SCO1/2
MLKGVKRMAASIKRKPLWLGLALLGVLVVAATLGLYQLGVGQESDEPQGGPIAMPSTQGDFSLTQLGDNEIAIVSFGYTYCPDVCPMNQAVKRQALAQLSDAQVPVMITVDPERDTLDRMSEYMQFFGSEFIGLVGNQEQLTDVAERYGVIWRRVEAPESAMAYTIDHSASLFLVNREGEILQRVLYSPTPHGLVSALESELGS